MIRELIEAGVNKLNVSLNANSKEKYNQICKPKYADAYKNVIKFIKMSKGFRNPSNCGYNSRDRNQSSKKIGRTNGS